MSFPPPPQSPATLPLPNVASPGSPAPNPQSSVAMSAPSPTQASSPVLTPVPTTFPLALQQQQQQRAYSTLNPNVITPAPASSAPTPTAPPPRPATVQQMLSHQQASQGQLPPGQKLTFPQPTLRQIQQQQQQQRTPPTPTGTLSGHPSQPAPLGGSPLSRAPAHPQGPSPAAPPTFQTYSAAQGPGLIRSSSNSVIPQTSSSPSAVIGRPMGAGQVAQARGTYARPPAGQLQYPQLQNQYQRHPGLSNPGSPAVPSTTPQQQFHPLHQNPLPLSPPTPSVGGFGASPTPQSLSSYPHPTTRLQNAPPASPSPVPPPQPALNSFHPFSPATVQASGGGLMQRLPGGGGGLDAQTQTTTVPPPPSQPRGGVGGRAQLPAGSNLPGGTVPVSGAPDLGRQLATKRSIQDLVAQIDPNEKVDEAVEEILGDLAEDFIDRVTSAACQLARHRKSTTLEAKDVLLHLDRCWHMKIPGFGGEEYKPFKKQKEDESHRMRMAAVKRTAVTTPPPPREATLPPPAQPSGGNPPWSGAEVPAAVPIKGSTMDLGLGVGVGVGVGVGTGVGTGVGVAGGLGNLGLGAGLMGIGNGMQTPMQDFSEPLT